MSVMSNPHYDQLMKDEAARVLAHHNIELAKKNNLSAWLWTNQRIEGELNPKPIGYGDCPEKWGALTDLNHSHLPHMPPGSSRLISACADYHMNGRNVLALGSVMTEKFLSTPVETYEKTRLPWKSFYIRLDGTKPFIKYGDSRGFDCHGIFVSRCPKPIRNTMYSSCEQVFCALPVGEPFEVSYSRATIYNSANEPVRVTAFTGRDESEWETAFASGAVETFSDSFEDTILAEQVVTENQVSLKRVLRLIFNAAKYINTINNVHREESQRLTSRKPEIDRILDILKDKEQMDALTSREKRRLNRQLARERKKIEGEHNITWVEPKKEAINKARSNGGGHKVGHHNVMGHMHTYYVGPKIDADGNRIPDSKRKKVERWVEEYWKGDEDLLTQPKEYRVRAPKENEGDRP